MWDIEGGKVASSDTNARSKQVALALFCMYKYIQMYPNAEHYFYL